jgi:hypothetical protein
MAEWTVDAEALDSVAQAMEQYGAGAGQIVDSVLQTQGAQLIKEQIAMLLPSSGRTWKGKPAPASVAMPGKFTQSNASLSVTISARGRYGYLYYPDDGSNTRRHAGNLQFMRRGAEEASSDIIDLCIGKLTENFS